MNEQAIKDAYDLFTAGGYNGSQEEFLSLISTNQQARKDAFELFSSAGYNGAEEEFLSLLGLGVTSKKKEESVSPSVQEDTLLDTLGTGQVGLSGFTRSSRYDEVVPGAVEPQIQREEAQVPVVQTISPKEKEKAQVDLSVSGMGDEILDAFEQGITQGGAVDPSLVLMMEGKEASEEEISKYINAYNDMEKNGPSRSMQAWREDFEKTDKGIWGFLKSISKHPLAATEIAVSSMAAMMNKASGEAAGVTLGAGTATGAVAGGLPGAIVGAAKSIPQAFVLAGATLETGLSFAEFLKEEVEKRGLNFDEEGVSKVLEDKDAMFNIRARAAGRGITIGMIDRLTMGVASGIVRSATKGTGRKVLAAALGTGVEMVGGAAGEAAARAVAGQEMDVAEIGFEAIGEIGTAPVSIAKGILERPSYKINGEVVSGPEMAKHVREAKDADFAGMKIEIKNDDVLKSVASERKETLRVRKEVYDSVKSSVGKANKEDVDAIVDLELRKKELANKRGSKSKEELKNIDSQIDEIYNKIESEDYAVQEQTTSEVPVQPEAKPSEEVAEGTPQAEPEVVTEEGVKEEDLTFEEATDEDISSEEAKTLFEKAEQKGAKQLVEVSRDDSGKIIAAKFEYQDEAGNTLSETVMSEMAPKQQSTVKPIEGGMGKFASAKAAVMKAVANVLPNTKVMHFENGKEAIAWMNENGVSTKGLDETSGGYFVNENTILINDEMATENTVAHEVVHALLIKAFKGNTQEFKNFKESIKQQLKEQGREDLVKDLEDFEQQYGTDPEEFITEFTAKIAEGIEVDANGKLTEEGKSTLQKLKDFILEFLRKTTNNPNLLKDATDQDIYDMLVDIGGKLRTGEDVSDYFEVGNETQGAVEGVSIVRESKTSAETQKNAPTLLAEQTLRELESKGYVVDKTFYDVVKVANGKVVYQVTDTSSPDTKSGFMFVEDGPNKGFTVSDIGTFTTLIESAYDLARSSKDNNKKVALVTVSLQADSVLSNPIIEDFLFEGLIKAISEKKITEKQAIKSISDSLEPFTNSIEIKSIQQNINKIEKALSKSKSPSTIKKYKRLLRYETKSLQEKDTDVAKKVRDFINQLNETGINQDFLNKIKKDNLLTFKIRKEIFNKSTETKGPLQKALASVGVTKMDAMQKYMEKGLFDMYESQKDEKSTGGKIVRASILDTGKYTVKEQMEMAEKEKSKSSFAYGPTVEDTYFFEKALDIKEADPNSGKTTRDIVKMYNDANETDHILSDTQRDPQLKSEILKWARENDIPFKHIGESLSGIATEKTVVKQQKKPSKASGTTQRANTISSYKKVAEKISKDIGDVKKIYDYGAGLGLGVDVMREKFGDIQIDSFEPNVENWKGKEKPTFVENEKLNKTRNYDAIISLNVLNVVPKEQRDAILTDIFMRLRRDGGKAYVSARGFKGDVDQAKSFELGPEEKSYIVNTKGEEVFQKGFDGDELLNYVRDFYKKFDKTGEFIKVQKDDTIGKKGVVITKGNPPQARREPLTPIEKERMEISAEKRREARDRAIERVKSEGLFPIKEAPKKEAPKKERNIYAFPMPFGKYKGQPYNTIPNGYAKWARENVKGFIPSKLAEEYGKKLDAESTVKQQKKKAVEAIPGYDRMVEQLDGVITKAKRRGADKERVYQDALGYLQGSKVYEDANDVEREALVRDLHKKLGIKERRVARAFATRKDTKKVTVSEKQALLDLIRAEAKAAKTAIQAWRAVSVAVKAELDTLFARGHISTRQVRAILNKALNLNFLNHDHVRRFVDYMEKVYNNAEYADNLKKAESTKKRIKRAVKNKDVQAETRDIAKKFLEIEPFFAEDIEAYLKVAEEVLNATSSTVGKVVDGDPTVSFKQAMNYENVLEYTEKALEFQEELKKQQILDKNADLVESGVLDPEMSLEEIKYIIKNLEENPDNLPSAEKQKMLRDFVKRYYDSYKAILKSVLDNGIDPFTGESVNLTQEQENLLRRFLDIDLETLSLKDAYKIIESIDNFIVNQNTDGMLGSVEAYEGRKGAKEAKAKGFKARNLRAFLSKGLGRGWAEQIEQLTLITERMFGERKALLWDKLSGLNDLMAVKNKAFTRYNKYVENYSNQFKNIKDFNSLENMFSRAILGYVSRTSQGSEIQQQNEFKKRKKNIKVSIETMKTGTEKQKKEAEVLMKIYDEILADSNSAREVASKSKDFNRKAVSYWQAAFSDIFDDLQSVSRGVYNTLLERDFKYLPDVYSRSEEGDIGGVEKMSKINSAFFGINENFDTKESGSIMIATKPELQDNPARIVSFDFDSNMARSLQSAIVDIETAPLIRKIDAFYNSPEIKTIIGAEDLAVLKNRVAGYIRATKRNEFQKYGELGKLAKVLNYISTFAAARALGSLTQIPKQTISVAFNTIINSGGRLPISEVLKAKEFIDKSGYAIGLRGIASQADIQSMNKILKRAEESKGMKALEALKSLSEFYLETFVAKPDVFIARASWLAYYKQELNRMGVDTKAIEWETHKLNKDAADYAQRKTDRQQNYSDSDLAGDLLRSKSPVVSMLRKTIFPFATFMLNKRSVLLGDISTLSNNMASKEDKKSAGLSMASNAVEMAIFHSLSIFLASTVYNFLAEALAGGDEEDEEKKEARELKGKMYRVQSTVNEFLSPVPVITDKYVDNGINKLLSMLDVDKKYQLPKAKEEAFESKIGMANIPLQKIDMAYDISEAALKGYVEYRGKKITLKEEDQENMKIVATIYGLYAMGALPADAGSIAQKAYYMIINKSKAKKKKSKSAMKTKIGGMSGKIKSELK